MDRLRWGFDYAGEGRVKNWSYCGGKIWRPSKRKDRSPLKPRLANARMVATRISPLISAKAPGSMSLKSTMSRLRRSRLAGRVAWERKMWGGPVNGMVRRRDSRSM